MTTGPRRRQSAVRRARSEYLGALYIMMGTDRSIDRVCEKANELGLSVTRTTVARYSRDAGWVEKAREYDERMAARQVEATLDEAIADDVLHARFYRLLRERTFARIEAMTDENMEARPYDLARMGDIAIKGERLISGKATERLSVMTSAMTMLTERIGPAVRQLIDAMRTGIAEGQPPEVLSRILEAETATFARTFDALVEAEFRAYGLTDTAEAS